MKITNIVEDKYDPVDFFKDEDPVVKIVLEKGKILSDFIKKNCAPWIKAAGGPGNMIYRGFDDIQSSKLAFTRPVRHDRRPRDTNKVDHQRMMQMVNSLGLTANRHNSAFVSGDEWEASEYGSVFVVMPIGSFNYTWSSKHRDWTSNSPQSIMQVKQTVLAELKAKYQAERKKFLSQVEQYKETVKNTPILNSLGDRLRVLFLEAAANNEQLFWGTAKNPFPNLKEKRVYKSDIPKPKSTQLLKYLNGLDLAEKKKFRTLLMKLRKTYLMIDLSNNIKQYGGSTKHIGIYPTWNSANKNMGATKWDPTKHSVDQLDVDHLKNKYSAVIQGDNGSLPKAIKSKNEIMIHTDQLLAIDLRLYRKVVLPMLQGKQPKLNSALAKQILTGEEDHW